MANCGYMLLLFVSLYLDSSCAGNTKTAQPGKVGPLYEQLVEAMADDIAERVAVRVKKELFELTDDSIDGYVTFLRREDGSVNFVRTWDEYRRGFGNPAGEFWLGLEKLHRLTTTRRYKLRVDLVDWSGEWKWAEYGHFSVASEKDGYRLSASGYNRSSTAGDSLLASNNAPTHGANGMKFSTIDRENDLDHSHCSETWKGGWWYRACHLSKATGLYKPAGYIGADAVNWHTAYNDFRSFRAATFKLSPV